MYRIVKKFGFEAAHQLTNVPPDHQCARLHGHSYVVEVALTSDDLNGDWIRDFADLDHFSRYLKDTCDHRNLNEVFADLGIPHATTAERIARWLCKVLLRNDPTLRNQLESVRVHETDNAWAEWRRLNELI